MDWLRIRSYKTGEGAVNSLLTSSITIYFKKNCRLAVVTLNKPLKNVPSSPLQGFLKWCQPCLMHETRKGARGVEEMHSI
jgi:ligand-binding sensor protein